VEVLFWEQEAVGSNPITPIPESLFLTQEQGFSCFSLTPVKQFYNSGGILASLVTIA
jgi:hypothetical protein